MTSTAERAEKVLAESLKWEKLSIDVEEGCGGGHKFRILIVSDAFSGKTTLQSHRLVQSAFGPLMPETHALTIYAYSPEKWSRMDEAARQTAGCADFA
ncbi:unnamed protein product [Caenorhabditis sp. 36 PRJEB53466]|nr:unnamed protein product [Caenorhabditis sp. 36 PRJEB53466]